MKIATSTSVLYLYDIFDAVDLVADCGFEGVDIWGGRPHLYRKDYNPTQMEQLKTRLAERNLAVSSFMPAFYRYPHSLSTPNPVVLNDSLEYMRLCINSAAFLGAPVVLIVPDFSLHGQTKAESLRRFTESIDQLADYAAPHALSLGIEVLFPDETDLVNTSAEAMEILQRLNRPNLGVVVDTGTLNLNQEDTDEMIRILGDRLLRVHGNDNDGRRGCESSRPYLPG